MGHTRQSFSPRHSSKGRSWGFNQITGAQDGTNETLYMTRAWLGRLRFHLFHRGDGDPDCHDHPWDFWTFPLRSYVEEVALPIRETVPLRILKRKDPPAPGDRFYKIVRVVPAFRLHYRPAEHCHRVLGAYMGTYTDGQDFPLGAELVDQFVGKPHGFGPNVKLCYAPVGLIPTIVWRGKLGRKWGFLKERDGRWCWQHWIDYVYHGGKAAPCQPETPVEESK